ncbi:hypothetical protein ACI2I2_22425 [Scandinavium sp. NPDC088450]|uniref:hypothetical protein n=1 Tax=Scandinavium sp. NPDC088450 TaxID=3364514 RepID=UPI00384F9AA8
MPVDLTCTPEQASRQSTPSVKRWLAFLLVLVSVSGLLTAWLWPSGVSSQTPLFWFCFPGAAIIFWLSIFIVRWVIYLAPVFNADGWDATREQDVELDIWRGQRRLGVIAQAIQLPHAIATESISAQMLMTNGISLPVQIDNSTHTIFHQSRFGRVSLSQDQRVASQLQALLLSAQLQSAFHQLAPGSELTVLLQTNLDASSFPGSLVQLQKMTERSIASSLRLTFMLDEGLKVIDNWLDNHDNGQHLLVVAMHISVKEVDGIGDAAVALLLQSDGSHSNGEIAYLHRPEQAQQIYGMNYALRQALLWGKTNAEDIRQIWFSGTGKTHKAENIFSQTEIQFPSTSPPCDIDLHAGDTENVSPWLSIAVAAENARSINAPQLVMNIPKNQPLPWFVVISSCAG